MPVDPIIIIIILVLQMRSPGTEKLVQSLTPALAVSICEAGSALPTCPVSPAGHSLLDRVCHFGSLEKCHHPDANQYEDLTHPTLGTKPLQ